MKGMTIFTLGHSTHSIGEFIGLLQAFGVKQLIDIRKLPGSERYPQFNQDRLKESLAANGICYRHMMGLGGLRKPKADSINRGWKNMGFRGYADYMQTEAFEEELGQLVKWAEELPTALMCAEALPWKCHRSLLSDALDARKVKVRHILSFTQASAHRRTSFAKVRKGKVSYPKVGD